TAFGNQRRHGWSVRTGSTQLIHAHPANRRHFSKLPEGQWQGLRKRGRTHRLHREDATGEELEDTAFTFRVHRVHPPSSRSLSGACSEKTCQDALRGSARLHAWNPCERDPSARTQI